jgi:hypothetical protein
MSFTGVGEHSIGKVVEFLVVTVILAEPRIRRGQR